MTSRTGSVQRCWEFWRKLVELRTGQWTRRVDFRLLAEALGTCRTRWGGGRWKSQKRKIEPLSPYVEERLNPKVIKRFVPELRIRKCFRVSRFLCCMYIYYGHSMYVSHIAISWLWYINSNPLDLFSMNIYCKIISNKYTMYI